MATKIALHTSPYYTTAEKIVTKSTSTAGSPALGSTAPKTWTAGLWAATVLAFDDLPVTTNNIDNMLRWIAAENRTGPVGWHSFTNPLNATRGATSKSTHGVSSPGYSSLLSGAYYTALMISQTNMAGIEHALGTNSTASTFSSAVVASPWAGSHYGGTPLKIADTPGIAPGTSTAGKATTSTNYRTTGTPNLPQTNVTGVAGPPTIETDIAGAVKSLINLTFWRRVSIFIGGAALVGVGIFLLAQSNKSVQSAESTAATAAVLA